MFTSTANILILNTGLVDGLSCFPEAGGIGPCWTVSGSFRQTKSCGYYRSRIPATLGIPFRKDFVAPINLFLDAVIGQGFFASGCGWSRQLNVYSVFFLKCFDMFTTALYTVQ
jgi:hypothetical protein